MDPTLALLDVAPAGPVNNGGPSSGALDHHLVEVHWGEVVQWCSGAVVVWCSGAVVKFVNNIGTLEQLGGTANYF